MAKMVMNPARYLRVGAGVAGSLLFLGMLGAAPYQASQKTEPDSVATLAAPAPPAAQVLAVSNADFTVASDAEYMTLTASARAHYAKLASRPSVMTHTVEDGESTWSIAERFGTDVGTIEALNPGTDPDRLAPGDQLRVAPNFSGLVHQVRSGDTIGGIASAYDVPSEKVLAANQLGADEVLSEGSLVFLPGARRRVQVASRSDSSRRAVEPKAVPAPESPAPAAAPAANGQWIWPLTRGQYFSEYGYREGGFHRGLDIAAPVGTPVVAVAAGTVVAAEWDGGYGFCVTVDHGNGLLTKYAHASKLLVSAGQTVKQGQQVILVGSTGNSTGPHVHFEVLVNGSTVNPRAYLP